MSSFSQGMSVNKFKHQREIARQSQQISLEKDALGQALEALQISYSKSAYEEDKPAFTMQNTDQDLARIEQRQQTKESIEKIYQRLNYLDQLQQKLRLTGPSRN